MTFEEKAQIEILKMAMNPKKRSSLIGGFNEERGKLVYTDNGSQIFTINAEDLYIDIDKCFPEANKNLIELLYDPEWDDLSVPTLQLRQTVEGRIVEQFETIDSKRRSIWVDRKLLARFDQPNVYIMGKSILYLEDKQGDRYGAILGVRM